MLRQAEFRQKLLLEVAGRMKPGLGTRELGEAFFDVCFKPLGLTTCLLAMADWDRDILYFPCYWEGGSRTRSHPARTLSVRPGLIGRILLSGEPLYCPDFSAQAEGGVVLSQIELESSLVPQSWYGTPLRSAGRPFGVASFQSYAVNAFNDDDRRLMDGLGALLSVPLAFQDPAYRGEVDS